MDKPTAQEASTKAQTPEKTEKGKRTRRFDGLPAQVWEWIRAVSLGGGLIESLAKIGTGNGHSLTSRRAAHVFERRLKNPKIRRVLVRECYLAGRHDLVDEIMRLLATLVVSDCIGRESRESLRALRSAERVLLQTRGTKRASGPGRARVSDKPGKGEGSSDPQGEVEGAFSLPPVNVTAKDTA